MIKVYFDDTLIDENYYSALTNDYKLFTDNFYLGSTASNTFKLSVAKTAVSSHPTEVKITDDTNTYYLIVDKIYEEKNFYVYDLVDKLVLFNFNYNASVLIDARAAEELTTTLSDILADMCTQAGVILDSTLTLINDIEVNWYDNTILARDYLSYIAELQGGFARILDDGKLTIVGHKMASQATIQIDNCEDFILGEKKTISRVVYDDGINVYEYGDETANTLYINQNNVYITDTTVVSNIYDEVVGLEFYLVETGKCQLDPSVRAGDIITFTDGTNSYLTIAGYSASFGGGYWLGNYSLNVASKQQEETQVIGLNTELKSIKTIIDRTNASLSIVASSVSTLEGEVENIELQRPFYRYSANADGSSMTTSPQVSTRYLGTYVGTEASSTYTDYTWTLIKGADGQDGEDGQDGVDGLPGTPGADGITYYTWIRYSDNADGTGLYATPTANTLYIGIAYNKTSATPSSTKTDYVWSKFKGDTGTAGSDGEDGVTTYTWIKYADDVNGTNLSDNPTNKLYIGLAHNKTTATESTTPSDYTWALIKGADGVNGSDGVGITSAVVTYQLHTNGTTAPTGSWLSSPPTPEQGKYLWVRTITTYSDNSSSTTYAVSYYATDGQTGSAGSDGADGTGISSTEVKYQIGTSGTVAPTGTWLSAIPTPEQGKYLWTRTIITYTDDSTSTAYSTSYYATDGQNGTDGDDGKSLWLAYCDEIDTYTGFSTNPADSDKDYYGMYVGLTQSNTATDYEWYPSNYKLDGDIGTLDNYVKTTVEGRIDIESGRITAEANRIDNLEDFTESVSTTGNYVKLTGTPKSNGAINQLSIKGFGLLPLYPGMAYPSQYTFPSALSFYTLVFDSVSTFNSTPSYVYINSPIPLQKITTTYDEISIVGNKASIIQRIGYSGTTPIVLGTPIVHDVGSVLLPTFDGDTYVKVLSATNLIFNSLYMQKNALTNVFASQLESSAMLSITNDAINSKVSKDGVISEINQSAEKISIDAEKISLEGYTTINNGFSVDLNGNATMNNATINGSTLKLADNTEIVGGNGILANLQYISMTNQLGLINDNNSGVSLAKGVIDIEAYIPANFTIKSAFLTLRAYKTRNFYILPETYNDTDEYGKITNIRVYKAATNYEYIYSDRGFWGIDTDNPPALTEITNALATGGYTNPTTAEVIVTSIDISSYLSTGQNTLWIQTADSIPSPYNDANVTIASQKTQSAVVILNVIGYSK